MAASKYVLGIKTNCVNRSRISVHFFFFQAEDGIRDYKVTGVQTCALPISPATSWSMALWCVSFPGLRLALVVRALALAVATTLARVVREELVDQTLEHDGDRKSVV